jgi:hypothetical protein
MLERPLPNGLFKYRFGASVGGREGFEGIGIGCLYRNETPRISTISRSPSSGLDRMIG